MNLSRIKRVAFIEDFNPKMGYPQYGNHTIKPKVVIVPVEVAVVELPKWKKRKIKELKEAKKEFKASITADYKPRVLVSTALV